MEGDLGLVSVPDLLQMICLGGYSRDIHLFDGPAQIGVIAVRNGCIDRCFGFGTWGEAAFYKLVNLRRGRYKVNDAQDSSASDASLTAHGWQELLMEAARRQDEAEHVAQAAAATGRVIAFPGPAHATTLATMLDAPVPVTTEIPAMLEPTAMVSVATAVAAPAAAALPAPPRPAWSPPVDRAPAAAPAATPDVRASAPPDITGLLDEATTCYLRRDLARAQAILQQCLTLRPGDRRVLQNLERLRRRK